MSKIFMEDSPIFDNEDQSRKLKCCDLSFTEKCWSSNFWEFVHRESPAKHQSQAVNLSE